MAAPRISRCLESNLSVMVASVDPLGEPSTCRALSLVSDDDLATATVYVPVATSVDTITNVNTTRRLTVVATHPLDHHSVQLKGAVIRTRPARDDERDVARRGFDGFGELL